MLEYGRDIIEILDGPVAYQNQAHVIFKITRKRNNDFNNMSSVLTFLYL